MKTNTLKGLSPPKLNQSDALLWFTDQIQLLKKLKKPSIKFEPGRLFFYYYDPKLKFELPYYDRFPLVIPLEIYNDGFLALNLHYLPFNYRKIFLEKLANLSVKNKDHDIERYRVSYDILKISSNIPEFKPCLKRYLFSHINSRILPIQPNQWQSALFLPVQKFVKKPSNYVWNESIQQIRGE